MLHGAAYRALGLVDWRYDAFEVTEDTLDEFVADLDPQWRGLSLTMPLKQAVIPLLDDVSPQAALLRAVNTVVLECNDGGARLLGTNTDVLGVEKALRMLTVDRVVRQGCVLGGGATAASALAGLARLGVTTVAVAARRPGVAQESLAVLAEPLGLRLSFHPLTQAPELLAGAEVAVSTLPGVAADSVADSLSGGPVGRRGVLLDVVYDPWPTRLAGVWAAGGGRVAGGLEMLLHQAGAQVEIMTGVPEAPIDAMRAALTA